jgi:DNA-3-methyladenine glycosylase II
VTEADRYGPARQHLAAADPRLAALIAARPGYDPRAGLAGLTALDPFGVLLFQIVGQQISVVAARAILGRIAALFGDRLPDPADVLAADPDQLLATGVSHRKAATIRAAARLFVDEHLDRDTLGRMTDERVEAVLTALPGIGTWTAQGFLVVALDRPDAFPAGDLAIRRAIRAVFGLDHLPNEREARERAERWRPYRALAAGYLIGWDAEQRSGTG